MRIVEALLGAVVVTTLAVGCEQKKPAPPAEPSASPRESEPETSKSSDKDEAPAIVAYPPGQGPPDAAPEEEKPPRTGLCSLLETGYDGDNTRSTEKFIIKIKDDRIVGGQYTYRGSYALDGKVENLSIPLVESKWIEIEMPMTTGTKDFQIKLKSDVMAVKGTAVQDKEGTCTWEPPPEPKKKKKK